jgi:beta-lactam-binding protein with PASTA domain
VLAAPAQATPKRVVIPWIVGRPQASAATRLRAAGLRVRVVRVRSLKAVGKVVAARPKAGTKVARGSRVTIAVSRGPGP